MRLLLILLSFSAYGAKTDLTFLNESGEVKKSYQLGTLYNSFKIVEVEGQAENSISFETYKAFDFAKVFKSALGPLSKYKEFYGLEFKGIDGYRIIIEMEKFLNRQAFLAVEIKGKKEFQILNHYKDSMVPLGPYYLVWKEKYKDGVARRRHHWIYQIKSVQPIKEIPKTLSPGEDVGQAVKYGFMNYMKQCYACHQINGVGGENGGELIINDKVRKLSDKHIKNYISNPRKIDKRASMPRFPKFIKHRRDRIINITHYLRHMDKIYHNEKITTKADEPSEYYKKLMQEFD